MVRRRKKKIPKEIAYNVFKLTCLNCHAEIDEHLQSKQPEMVIFTCMSEGCGKHWMVKSATLVSKG